MSSSKCQTICKFSVTVCLVISTLFLLALCVHGGESQKCTEQYNSDYIDMTYRCGNRYGQAIKYFDTVAAYAPGSTQFKYWLNLLLGAASNDFVINIYYPNGTLWIHEEGKSGLTNVVNYYAALDEWRMTMSINHYYTVQTNTYGQNLKVTLHYSYETHAKLQSSGLIQFRQSNAEVECEESSQGQVHLTSFNIYVLRDFFV